MEWDESNRGLKVKRGKKLAMKTSPSITYSVLRKVAKERRSNFHRNRYNMEETYHMLYGDGSRALFLPGSQTEPFTLSRYQEEVRKGLQKDNFISVDRSRV